MFGCACLTAGCASEDTIMEPREGRFTEPASVDAPVDLITIEHADRSLELWPYTSVGLSGVPSDPINLVFVGKASPVAIRSALMALYVTAGGGLALITHGTPDLSGETLAQRARSGAR